MFHRRGFLGALGGAFGWLFGVKESSAADPHKSLIEQYVDVICERYDRSLIWPGMKKTLIESIAKYGAAMIWRVPFNISRKPAELWVLPWDMVELRFTGCWLTNRAPGRLIDGKEWKSVCIPFDQVDHYVFPEHFLA